MNENSVVKAVIDVLRYSGFKVWRMNAGKVRTAKGHLVSLAPAGVSDVIGIAPSGRFVAVECKFVKNKPTGLQNDFLREINRMGGYGAVAYGSQDVDWIIKEEKEWLFMTQKNTNPSKPK